MFNSGGLILTGTLKHLLAFKVLTHLSTQIYTHLPKPDQEQAFTRTIVSQTGSNNATLLSILLMLQCTIVTLCTIWRGKEAHQHLLCFLVYFSCPILKIVAANGGRKAKAKKWTIQKAKVAKKWTGPL